ncbi:hypothetical protein OGAPHI_007334 [Ogataea philodendri]|uniref:ER membrane protein complex subunit 10 n=1 Tax=Ogataea philodendri TaxID=1378263 RepID=A0A9P8NVD3_9ASCO|nr:uncharacterized protein OGAPHI_007334 [Ogataea philodendri]KAH3660129.1 hypothetical protein OGAPHI_007334 [Ogataea philodendri]
MNLVFLLVWASCCLAFSLNENKTYQLTAQNSATPATEFAELYFTNRWRLKDTAQLPDDVYCVGLAFESEPVFPCFNTKQLNFPLNDTLVVEVYNNEVSALSLLESDNAQKSIVKVVSPQIIYPPREDPPQDHKAAPVAEKSFIQKYWMYIVPPLIILMVMSPE